MSSSCPANRLTLNVPAAGDGDIVSCLVVAGGPISVARIEFPSSARRGEEVSVRAERGTDIHGQLTWKPAGGATLKVGGESLVADVNGFARWRVPRDAPTGSYILGAWKDGSDGVLPATLKGEQPVMKVMD